MRALVTGATGFVGSRLARRLVAEGHSVGVVSRAGSNRDQLADVVDRIEFYPVDETAESVRQAVSRSRPDVVFHLATYYARDHRCEDLEPMLEANVAFPLRLVDAMTREGVRRFVNTASAWQYSDPQQYRPVCLHSATKEAFQALLEYFVDAGKIDAITLALHDTYGPGDPRRKIFSLLRDRAGTTEVLEMSGGEQLIDLIHVDDAVAAYAIAAQRLLERDGAAHEVYSVSGGRPLSLRRVVETYLVNAGLDVPIRWGGRLYHEREVMVPWAGGAALPGWRPQVDVEEGLRRLALGQ